MQIIKLCKENFSLILILILATLLRVYGADYQSIAIDEILSMNNSDPKLSLKQLYDSVLFWEYLPHLYFYLLRIVFEIFGYTTMVGRLFSAFIGVLGVYAIYLLGKEIFNKRAGLIAALFLSVNYIHIFYSQEIRLYGMLFLFSTLSFYRLVIFIRNSTLRNAVYYGIFTGLIINAHFFGFITVFAQCIILLYFIIKTPSYQRKTILINAILAGFVAILIILPGYEAIMRMLEINSFWLAPPTADVYTNIIKEFFGNSEMVLFGVGLLFMGYLIAVFNQNEKNDLQNIKKNDLIFSSIIFFIWVVISLLIPLLKSHLDVSMIINRYFISIVAAILVVLAIGVETIKNNTVKTILVVYISLFSIVDLFAVRKYYSTPNKTQFRELTDSIKMKNTDKSKIVTVWSWLIPYFFQNDSQIKIENSKIEDYVFNLKNGTIKPDAFWFVNTGAPNFELAPDLKQYLEETFFLKEKLEFNDIWANYYVPKVETEIKVSTNDFNLSMFSPSQLDSNGNLTLLENANLKTDFFALEKGNYEMIIDANSLPENPIGGENAHFKIRLNGIEIGNYYLSEKSNASEKIISFSYDKNEKVRFQLIYDNDLLLDGKDRNAIIRSIKLIKK